MVILIPHRIRGNIYVRELGRAYTDLGHTVVFGPENLFESSLEPDLIHLQWPEETYRAFGDGPLSDRVSRLLRRLDDHRSRGAKLAWTVHNLAPHEHGDSEIDRDAYRGVLGRADLVHHHCDESKKLLAKRYGPDHTPAELIAPHGHYLAYPNTISKSDARSRLGLSGSAVVFLHFGQIRGYKGLSVVRSAFRRARVANKHLVIAGKLLGVESRVRRARLRLAAKLSRRQHLHLRRIADEEVQLFMNAADAVVLGHRRGLNSGVAVLGMTFGRLVIGPAIGCIGSILEQGRNLVYEAENIVSLQQALERVPEMDRNAVEARNRQVAAGWRWSGIARGVAERLGSSTDDWRSEAGVRADP